MLTIHVCIGSACHIKGSYNIINKLQSVIQEKQLGDRVEIKAALCLGNGTNAVSIKIDDGDVLSLSEKDVEQFVEKHIMSRL